MAQLRMTLTAETSFIQDAIVTVSRVHDALSRRHGQRFRALDRRIEAIAEGFTVPEPVHLGDCIFCFPAPPEFVAIIAEARALGVI